MSRFTFSVLFLPLIALILQVVALTSSSQTMQEIDQAVEKGTRLEAISIAKAAASKDPRLAGILPQLYPLISDYAVEFPFENIKLTAIRDKPYDQRVSEQLGAATFHSSIEKIVQLAKDRRVVILNEAHDLPQHRAFGWLLAKELKQQGFEYLAMENLTRPDFRAGLVTFDYPDLQSGFYSREPIFGDFLRQANQIGFKLVAYEIDFPSQADPQDSFASILERENAQSDNLIKHVLKQDSQSKVLIYCGYDHAKEDWTKLDDGRELGWMAAQVARKSGLDPLTIDQVGGSYNPKSQQVDPIFKRVFDTGKLTESSIVSLANDELLVSDRYRGSVDVTVFHPVQTMSEGRPDWLRMGGYRKPVQIRNQDYYRQGPTLLQAFLESETKAPIPVDQVMIDSSNGSSCLLLPAGNYRLVIEGPPGELKTGPSISVSGQ